MNTDYFMKCYDDELLNKIINLVKTDDDPFMDMVRNMPEHITMLEKFGKAVSNDVSGRIPLDKFTHEEMVVFTHVTMIILNPNVERLHTACYYYFNLDKPDHELNFIKDLKDNYPKKYKKYKKVVLDAPHGLELVRK